MFSQLRAGRLHPRLLVHGWPVTQQLCTPGHDPVPVGSGERPGRHAPPSPTELTSPPGRERFVLWTHLVKVAIKWPSRGFPSF